MSYFPDLGQSTLSARGESVRAVGWLSTEQEYTRGRVPTGLIPALQFLRQRWGEVFRVLGWWPAWMGPHACEYCDSHRESGEIAVPFGDLLLVAPCMIVHYVEQHAYLPPSVFIEAVMSCPEPGTPLYAEQVAFAARPDLHGLARVRVARG